jgi:hypothetical protein
MVSVMDTISRIPPWMTGAASTTANFVTISDSFYSKTLTDNEALFCASYIEHTFYKGIVKQKPNHAQLERPVFAPKTVIKRYENLPTMNVAKCFA